MLLDGNGFWPTSLLQWGQLAAVYCVTLGGAVLAFWRFLIAPLHKSIAGEAAVRERALEGVGDRIAEIARAATTSIGRVEILERQMERAVTDQERIHHDLGRLEALLKSFGENLHIREMERVEQMGEIRERMVRIETKIDIAQGRVHDNGIAHQRER